jgi:hypothetical protein
MRGGIETGELLIGSGSPARELKVLSRMRGMRGSVPQQGDKVYL